MFLEWLSTKISKMVPLRWTKWPPELKIEKPLNDISHARFQNNFTEMFLWCSFTKIVKKLFSTN